MKNVIFLAVLAMLLVSASAAIGFTGFYNPPSKGTLMTIKVNAHDSSDPYLRDWNLFIDKAPGTYLGNGVFANSSSSTHYVAYAHSGSTVTYRIYLTPGAHTIYLDIGQSGGSKYGVYNGTMWINSQAYPFNGLNVNIPFATSIIVPK